MFLAAHTCLSIGLGESQAWAREKREREITGLKIVQVRCHLPGHRLSLSRNLRLNGISRNACPRNRTVGTVGTKGLLQPRGWKRKRAAPVEGRVAGGWGGWLPCLFRAHTRTHTHAARACISVRVSWGWTTGQGRRQRGEIGTQGRWEARG